VLNRFDIAATLRPLHCSRPPSFSEEELLHLCAGGWPFVRPRKHPPSDLTPPPDRHHFGRRIPIEMISAHDHIDRTVTPDSLNSHHQ
jgi:hypothetical protein